MMDNQQERTVTPQKREVNEITPMMTTFLSESICQTPDTVGTTEYQLCVPCFSIEFALVIYFIYGNIYVSMLFSQVIPLLLLPLSPKVCSLQLCLLFCPACRIIRTVFLNFIWRRCGEKGTFLHFWWENKLVQSLMRTVWRFLKKLGIELPYNPAIPVLGRHPEETRTERDTCTLMFTAALFTTAQTWKQPGCPSADDG